MLNEEAIRRFAKRIDDGLDRGARAGMLDRAPRFCVSAAHGFFVTINPDPDRWGELSVSERHLDAWLHRRAVYDWCGWPRPLRRILSRHPSWAAMDIARALIRQRSGHAGIMPATGPDLG